MEIIPELPGRQEGDCHKESKIPDKREESYDKPSFNSRSLWFSDYFKDLE